jgi:hypothetical protein
LEVAWRFREAGGIIGKVEERMGTWNMAIEIVDLITH